MLFRTARGRGHNPAVVPQTFHAFGLVKNFYGFNAGIQIVNLGAGGPSGFVEGTAGAIMPWPYITAVRNFLFGFPYGTADSRRATPSSPNVGSGVPAIAPVGYVKVQTGPTVTY